MIYSNLAGTMSESFTIGKRGVKLLQGTETPTASLKAPIGSLYLKKSADVVRVYQLVADAQWEPLLTAGSIPFLLAQSDENIPNGKALSVSGGALEFSPATGVIKVANNPAFAGVGGIVLPSGTTNQRPSSPSASQLRYNTTDQRLETFQSGEWKYLVTDSNYAQRSYQRQFSASDLVSGILTIEHNLNQKYVMISVFDEDDYVVVPDRIKVISENQVVIDFTSFEITGDWKILVTR